MTKSDSSRNDEYAFSTLDTKTQESLKRMQRYIIDWLRLKGRISKWRLRHKRCCQWLVKTSSISYLVLIYIVDDKYFRISAFTFEGESKSAERTLSSAESTYFFGRVSDLKEYLEIDLEASKITLKKTKTNQVGDYQEFADDAQAFDDLDVDFSGEL